ncbi:hypothetical protein PNEG_01632 [Pneumocystis murina B123]|uniref:Palmitoyltransferase n=1 Tax=Pneumocystis murina (strain B123) TaxID=1069680 RepID=M7P959_PNEMU|nr:hypothetical protein PNEG_01632 [Pneumocystis murina B123]EMR10380.1 hypothetical protein PNEG_01632 [Pneumocystis murina B123]
MLSFHVKLKPYLHKLTTYIPRAIVYCLLLWSFWVYTWTICIKTVSNFYGIILIFFASIGFIISFWCYTATTFTFPGSPRGNDGYVCIESRNYSTFISVKQNGSARFCNKCEILKPDRTHHCSICNYCILKMDHHCPWLSNCIGFANYKQFLLFLIYISIYSIYLFISSLIILYKFIILLNIPSKNVIPVNWMLLLVISGVFSIVLGIFTIWHIFLVSRNLTTIEALKQTCYIGNLNNDDSRSNSKIRNAFDLGWKKNWIQVMGSNKFLWFFPIVNNLGTGESFPVNNDIAKKLYEYFHHSKNII